ncbi:hypothetical protein C8A00DRAFT_16007 [Chaetomidium leptoderma]|uniref:Uncharacterized protein n=1 Tax=Chaetomidium leptoderma TaxID=669021 RepID=A0AAN6VK44_9PEZI|nr:hypothetical protein C8A00DRAFT_16007 [Chaetomidium leptoderma]
MKNLGLVVLSGIALLQGVTAACCRGNRCLKAVVSADQDGLDDCAANLVVTATLPARALTETITVVETAVATALFTEELTETAATETLLFTETTTITASQTDIVSEIVTVVVTTTDIQEAATTVTSTSTNYQAGVTLKARQTASALPLPDYASAACAGWDQYVNACKCAGFETTTVTVPAAVETVTVTADKAVTTTAATVTTTKTDTVSVTATALVTEIDSILVTEIATSTTTITVSTTTTVLATSTPTTVIPLTCKPKGVSFRASNPFPDGTTRWMNVVSSTIIAWQTFTSNPSASGLATSTWVLDSDGYLELAGAVGTATSVLVPHVNLSTMGPSVQVQMKAKPDVETAVAAGTAVRVKGCVNAGTGVLTLAGNGRYNMVACGNSLYLSTGDGSDIRSDCVKLTPMAA